MSQQPRELVELAAALRGQYEIEREIGRGGMGVVYLARDLKLDRWVAVKTLPAHLAADERVRERFLREARTAGQLSHPGIVPVHRADEIEGQVFFVMTFVDGESLADRVRRLGPLPAAEVAAIVRDVADALDAAHRRGIVHRDVKAENILLDAATGRAMVTDFGIARLAEAAPLTGTGLVLGTVYYMSPEHVAGEPTDGRSDIYSLGVAAFLALTGRFPFESDMPSAILVAHVTKRAPAVRDVKPDVPEAIAAIVDRCLAREPERRFASGKDLCEALSAAGMGNGEWGMGPNAATPARRSGTPVGEAPVSDSPLPIPHSRFMSDTSAQAVWQRAAELQEGGEGAAPLAPRPAGAVPPSPSAAYPMDVVRDAAREAGIRTQYVERAIAERMPDGVERSTSPQSPVPTPEPRDLLPGEKNLWTGEATRLSYEITVPGEVPERDYDRVVETIRRTLGDVGSVGTVGRSFTWSSADPQRKVHVSVQMRGGNTTLRVDERLSPVVGNVFGGGVGGFGGGAAGVVMGITMGATQAGPLAFGAGLGWMGIAYAGTRIFYRRLVGKRRRQLQELLRSIAHEVEQIVDDRSRGLPSGPQGQALLR